MRWLEARLVADVPTGETDALGNPVTRREELGSVPARLTPWGEAATENPGNPYADAPLTLVTPAPLSLVRRAGTVVTDVSGETEAYAVEQVSDVGRWRLVSCRRRKGEAWQG